MIAHRPSPGAFFGRAASACCMLAVAVGLLGAAPANADRVIESSGPVERLWIGDDLACQVSYVQGGTFEFYPPDTVPGDCGTFIAVDGTLYAPNFDAHGSTATSDLGSPAVLTPVREILSGTGTAVDPFVVTTDVTAAGGTVAVQQRVSYISGSSRYRVDIFVRDESGASRDLRVYHAGDCYASGSDIGYGFRRPEIKSVGCSQTVNNEPAARTVQMLPLTSGSNGVEDRFWRVWERIGGLEDFDGSCLCNESVDNGVGLSWHQQLNGVETRVFSLEVAFTESTPAVRVDTDGDALPDSWETGQSPTADAENLAPLGADPNRKDIFVHADWMQGCKPPVGWERRAIDMFAQHDIALHVDSGSDSNNADGKWGARSRAGEVSFVDDLDLGSMWQTVDGIKDTYLTPSGRRRAFHYVLFANKFGGSGARGRSRGIPDSDLVIANCSHHGRADATFFVHELGHNLGLRHGGDEDRAAKPNYHSTMNYGWALWALENTNRFVGYSAAARPTIEERNLSELAKLPTPTFWHCPGDEVGTPSRRIEAVGATGAANDLNCNAIWGEPFALSDLDKSGSLDTLTGFNDVAALGYDGAGLIGALTLPERHDAAIPEPEFGEDEIAEQRAVEQAAAQQAAKQLMVVTKVRRVRFPLRSSQKTAVPVQVVTVAGSPVRRATIRVAGATLTGGRRRLVTDRRGRAVMRFTMRSTKRLKITASRAKHATGTLLLPVTDTRKRLAISSVPRQLITRNGRTKTIRLTVTSKGRPVPGVKVLVRGGQLLPARARPRTNRRGGVAIRVRLRSSMQLTVVAQRPGYRPVTLAIPIQ